MPPSPQQSREARDLLGNYYVNTWESFLRYIGCVQSFSCEFDWPEWLNFMALIDFFLDDPIKTFIKVG